MAVCRECYRTKFSESDESGNCHMRGNRLSSPFAQMMKSPLKPTNNISVSMGELINLNNFASSFLYIVLFCVNYLESGRTSARAINFDKENHQMVGLRVTPSDC